MPIRSPEEWDVVTLNGKESPALCELSGFDREYDWQIAAPAGTVGGTAWYRGAPLVKGTIRCHMTTDEEVYQWYVWTKNLGPKGVNSAGQRPVTPPVPIYHPSLFTLGINAVNITKITAVRMAQFGSPGKYIGEIGCLEYRKPIKVVAVADGPIPHTDPEKPKPPTAQSARAAAVAKSLARAQAVTRSLVGE
jgi:hypothetical protein